DEMMLSGPVPRIWMPWWAPEADRDQAAMAAAREDLLTRVLPFIEQQLEGREYLAGDFSLADVPFMALAMVLQVDGLSLQRLPGVESYLARLRGRRSYRSIDPETRPDDSAGSNV